MDQDRPGWNPPSTNTGGAPAPDHVVTAGGPRRRSRVGTGVAVAAVGLGVLGLMGTAYAASGSPSPTPTTSSGAPMPGADRPHGMPGHDGSRGAGGGLDGGFGMRGAGMGIHGSFVAPKAGGGYQTVHTQRGTVTAVSATSITVTSEDGYAKTYAVTATTVVHAQRDGIASIAKGDEVMLIGIESGDTVTAVQIMDRTGVKAGLAPLAPPRPTPSASSTASGTA